MKYAKVVEVREFSSAHGTFGEFWVLDEHGIEVLVRVAGAFDPVKNEIVMTDDEILAQLNADARDD